MHNYVQVPIETQTTVHVSVVEGFVAGILVHHGGKRRTIGAVEAAKVANEVREDIVRSLSTAFHVDSLLVASTGWAVRMMTAGTPSSSRHRFSSGWTSQPEPMMTTCP